MPTLPSGRRVEFSLERFTAMLDQLAPADAACLCDALIEPDDLMHVLDIVLFRSGQDEPYFAAQVLSQWQSLAVAWDASDREFFRGYLGSTPSLWARADAIAVLKQSVNGLHLAADENSPLADVMAQESLLQAA